MVGKAGGRSALPKKKGRTAVLYILPHVIIGHCRLFQWVVRTRKNTPIFHNFSLFNWFIKTSVPPLGDSFGPSPNNIQCVWIFYKIIIVLQKEPLCNVKSLEIIVCTYTLKISVLYNGLLSLL